MENFIPQPHPYSRKPPGAAVIQPPGATVIQPPVTGTSAKTVKRPRAAAISYTDEQKKIVMFLIEMKKAKEKGAVESACAVVNMSRSKPVYKWGAFRPPDSTVFAEGRPGPDAERRSLEIIESVQDWSLLSDSEFGLLFESHKPASCYEKEV